MKIYKSQMSTRKKKNYSSCTDLIKLNTNQFSLKVKDDFRILILKYYLSLDIWEIPAALAPTVAP